MKPHHFSHIAENSARLLFTTLQNCEALSRAELAQITGLSRPTVSGAIERLENWQLVRATSRKTKGMGRAGIIYEINHEFGLVAALSVDHRSARLQIQDFSCCTVFSSCFDITSADSAKALTDLIINKIEQAIKPFSIPLKSIGLALAAPVDPIQKKVVNLPSLPFSLASKIDWVATFQTHFNVPVTLDNDVNWAAQCEVNHGVASDIRHFIYIFLDRGIGAGIYLDGKVIKGGNGLAGELGYVKVTDDVALQDYVEQVSGNTHNDALSKVSDVIATAAIIVNPDALIFGGKLSQNAAFLEQLSSVLSSKLLRPISLLPSAMPVTGPLIGAADGAYDTLLAGTPLFLSTHSKNKKGNHENL